MCTRCPLLPHYFHHINSEFLVDQTWGGHERKPQLLPLPPRPSDPPFLLVAHTKNEEQNTRSLCGGFTYKRLPTTTTNTFRREQCGSNFAEGQMSTHLPCSFTTFAKEKTHFHPLLLWRVSSPNPLIFYPQKTFTDYRALLLLKPFPKIVSSDDDNYKVTRLSQFSVV